MGGIVAKEKLVDADGAPKHVFRLDEPELRFLWGGSVPVYGSCLRWLEARGVGLIVTLTIEPLRSGRNINHLPYDMNETEWADGDEDLLETAPASLEFLHVPVADGGPPMPELAGQLVEAVAEFRRRNPSRDVYVHCWKGGRRTSTVLALLARHFAPRLDAKGALAAVYRCNARSKDGLGDAQMRFVMTGEVSQEDRKTFAPVVRTPPASEAWGTRQPPPRERVGDGACIEQEAKETRETKEANGAKEEKSGGGGQRTASERPTPERDASSDTDEALWIKEWSRLERQHRATLMVTQGCGRRGQACVDGILRDMTAHLARRPQSLSAACFRLPGYDRVDDDNGMEGAATGVAIAASGCAQQ